MGTEFWRCRGQGLNIPVCLRGRDPTFPARPSQCADVYMACAAMGRAGMEAACASLDTLEPTVTTVSSCWAGTPLQPEQDGTSACSLASF